MNQPLSPAQTQPATLQRRLVNLLVALVVIAAAAAMFIFSYSGVHAIAELGGVSAQLARYYPGLFDAVLVIACVAAVTLREGRWWARLWAWLVIIVVLAAIGTTDVLHAMNYTLRHRPTEGIVAAAPAVAVLLAFSLLLTMLRQSRTPAAQPAVPPAPLDVPALPAAISAPPIALPAAPAAPEAPEAPEAVAAPKDSPAPDLAPTREIPAIADAPEVPPAAAPPPAHAATEPNKAIAPAAPAPAAPAPAAPAPEAAASATAASETAPAQDEPAPPTVAVPALTRETVPLRGPQGIRYAGNGVPGMAGKPQAAERDASPGEENWESEEAGPFAGLVYPAREDHADLDAAADADDVNDTETGRPAPGKNPPEPDDDAPPFATAPFAPVPRLNRVRSMPTPPADEDE